MLSFFKKKADRPILYSIPETNKEYILICKDNGEYKVFTEADSLTEIKDELNMLLDNAEKKYLAKSK